MKAVIMAGGEGTRLRPLTCGIPKPMVPIANKPVMEHIINLVKNYHIEQVAVTMAYLPSVIKDYFGNGEDFELSIKYYTETTPLGTGGSVKNAEDFLDDTFIIISGDALTDINLEEAISFHKAKGSMATLVLKRVQLPLEYGVVITDVNDKIIRFLEKPSWGEVFSDTINTGIYILEPEVLNYYKKGDNFDFSKDLFPKLLRDDVPMYGYIAEGYWNDIGNLKVYNEVNQDILNKAIALKNNYREIQQGIFVGENTVIEENCSLIAPVYIGNNCVIRKNAYITSSIIGDNCDIGESCSIKRSVIWKNCSLAYNVHCRGAVVCNNVIIKNSAQIFENTVLGNDTLILSGAIVKPNIKVWPEKTIEEDTVLSQNLVWGSKASKTLFGYRDISGEINIDISPEFSSKLGSAIGSMYKEASTLIISTDESSASHVVKESIISGILSTGITVVDIDSVPMPINRYAVRFYNADGGVHIRKDFNQKEENKIHIEIIDSNGINIDRNTERKIENIFARGDFKRCNADKIKQIKSINNFAEFYLQNSINMLSHIINKNRKQLKLIIGSRSQLISFYAKAYLENIGCEVISSINASSDNYVELIAEETVKKGAELGIAFSEDGESIILTDHMGNIIDNQKYTALSALIALKYDKKSSIVVPYTASRKIEEMARKYAATVIRTKSNPSEIMKNMLKSYDNKQMESVQYLLHYDAIRGIGCILDYLIKEEKTLAAAIAELPELYMEKSEVHCDWKYKGKVIRRFVEDHKEKDLELFEGVKINDDKGWVLVLPDSDRPVCKLYAEGATEEYAKELAAIYSEKISGIVSTDID